MCCLKLSYQQNAKGIVALRELEIKPSSPHLDWLAICAICGIPEVMRSAWSPPKCTLSPSTPNVVKFSQLHSIRRRCVDTSRNRELGLYPLIEQVLLEVIATYEANATAAEKFSVHLPLETNASGPTFMTDFCLALMRVNVCSFHCVFNILSVHHIYTPDSIYSSWVTLLRST